MSKDMAACAAKAGSISAALSELNACAVAEVFKHMVQVVPEEMFEELTWLLGATVEDVLDRLAYEQVVDYFTKGARALALASWLSQRVAEKQQVTVSSPMASGVVAHTVDPVLMEGVTALREIFGQLSGAATEATAARPLSVAKVEAPKQSACVALLAPRRNMFLQVLEA